MKKLHDYKTTINWTGNKGTGTNSYTNYERSHTIFVDGKQEILGSSDPAFKGDRTKHNPEDLLVASLSSCHMLWFLGLCSQAGVIVVDYTDNATGIMVETGNGSGHFTEVTLNPVVVVSNSSMVDKANALHEQANKMCFIANSCNFPVHHKSICTSIEPDVMPGK